MVAFNIITYSIHYLVVSELVTYSIHYLVVSELVTTITEVLPHDNYYRGVTS